MNTPDNSHQSENLAAPEPLIAALRQSIPGPLFVPATLDESILRAASAHLIPQEVPRFRWLRLISWLAAGTAVVVAGVVLLAPHRAVRNLSKAPVFAREDINQDGTVDILDAFALARQLKQRAIAAPALDLNGDGVVDERDMQIIASEAVKLDKGGRS